MTATPERIIDIAIGFMGAKQLEAANRIGLFSALAGGPADTAELAAATGRAERQVRILADAMNGLGLVEREAGRYRLADDAATYLAGAGDLDLSPFLAFLGGISYRQWLGYDATVDTDAPGALELDEGGWAEFLAGVMRYNELHAEQLGRVIDFSRYRAALDFGGFTPAYSLAAMRQNPELNVRFVTDPESAAAAAAAIVEEGCSGRASAEEVSVVGARPGGAHDLVLVAQVVHRFTAEQNRGMLEACRDAAVPGATLMILDFFLDDAPRQRAIDALHAGEYYNIDGTVVYPVEEVREWLAASGWRYERLVGLPGSPRVLEAVAI